MHRYVAFLRGINVTGHNLVKMEELRKIIATTGWGNIATYIQSGNVLFDTAEPEETLAPAIASLLLHKLGYDVPTMVRSIDDVRATVSANPFRETIATDKRKLYVAFLSAIPHQDQIAQLLPYCLQGEEIAIRNRELYLMFHSYSDTKLTHNIMERKLNLQATTRNWNTVNKVLQL